MTNGRRSGKGGRGAKPRHRMGVEVAPLPAQDNNQVQDLAQAPEVKVISTLLVPFSIGSVLQRAVQEAEDAYTQLVGGPKVRVLEKGGDTLINTLGKNDPWAAGQALL